MEDTIIEYLELYKKEIQNNLKENFMIVSQCKSRCANGKICSCRALPFAQYCKKHSANVSRFVPDLVYHIHLPGKTDVNCPACQIVGINS
tara:strand:+ start:4262 stop:4531 length:270 start_codon:yes stop_codon:yes gene_type:complete